MIAERADTRLGNSAGIASPTTRAPSARVQGDAGRMRSRVNKATGNATDRLIQRVTRQFTKEQANHEH
jgi:hypothetical protein